MPRIITFEPSQNGGKNLWNRIKGVWKYFQSFESFTKVTILTSLLIILSTPFIVRNTQLFNPKAAEFQSNLKKPPLCVGLGDINQDSVITKDDIILFEQYLGKEQVVDEKTVKRADVDRDGSISSRDRDLLVRYLTEGLQTDLQCPKMQYAQGEFIVKFKDTVTKPADLVFQQGLDFQSSTEDRSDSLDKLIKEHRVQKIKSLFRAESSVNETLGQRKETFSKHMEEAKNKYPKRNKRIPTGSTIPSLYHIYVVSVTEDIDIEAAVSAFNQDTHVEYAQPNRVVQISSLPNDTYMDPDQDGAWSVGAWGQTYEDLWGLKKIQADAAWDVTQGEGIVVAVVDTGLDYSHIDIRENRWINPQEIAGNDIDDDLNGYIDDEIGWNFVSDNNSPSDDNGHGTHVAGTISAIGNNSVGIVGVAPKARIMPVKGLDRVGSGWVDDLAKAIVYAGENGADVLNNSWGFASSITSDPLLEDAVQTAYGMGAVVVFAAGNSTKDVAFTVPQNMAETIVVGASDSLDQKANFSNYGFLVDIMAPGGESSVVTNPDNILSLQAFGTNLGPLVSDGYIRLRGTSMAAPHAAGVAALILAHRPTFTNEDVRHVLRTSADDIGEQGVDLFTGPGRLNAIKALQVESVLRSQITSPRSGSALDYAAATVWIMGTAGGADFLKYQLFYGRRRSTGVEWIPLDTPVSAPVENGLLGTWKTKALPTGTYLVRLTATSLSGSKFDAFAQVGLERTPILQITPKTRLETNFFARISGERIVWEKFPFFPWIGGNSVFLYDLATDVERQIGPGSSGKIARHPVISGDRIVYVEEPTTRTAAEDIYLYDLTTETRYRLTSDGSNNWPFGSKFPPDFSGNLIAWAGDISSSQKLYGCYYDMLTHKCQIKQIAQASGDDSFWDPAIAGNKIVYTKIQYNPWPISDSVLNLYDPMTDKTSQLGSDQAEPLSVEASENRVVYFDFRSGTGLMDLYMYNLASGSEQRITQIPSVHWYDFQPNRPSISNDRIVWADSRDGNANVYLYDLATGIEEQITGDPDYQYDPAIDGDRIVWTGDVPITGTNLVGADTFLYDIAKSNRGPMLASIPDQLINEGQPLTFTVSAQDSNASDTLSLKVELVGGASLETVGATFTDHGNRTGTFTWAPSAGQSGSYSFIFTASDGQLEDAQHVLIAVEEVANHPPILDPINNQSVSEGQTLTLLVNAQDLDGDTLTYSSNSLPPGATFDTETHTFIWTPAYDQAGTHELTFTVSDGKLTDAETITITVTDIPVSVLSIDLKPNPFSPNGDKQKDTTTISGTFNHQASWTLQILASTGTLVRQATGSGTTVSAVWDGKNSSGSLVKDGTFTYTLSGIDTGGSKATKSGTVKVDTVKPTLSNVTDSPDPFKPSIGQTTTISFNLSESSTVKLQIVATEEGTVGTIVREGSAKYNAGTRTIVWDGKDTTGKLVSPNIYTYKLQALDNADNISSIVQGTVKVQ